MSAPPYIPMWIGDYMADTRHLTTLEHGAYHLLIYAYWGNEGPLPDDDTRLARIVGLSPREWAKARKTISEFFKIGGGQWRHNRIERELAKIRGRSQSNSEAAKARWAKNERNASAMQTHSERNADAMQTQSVRNASRVQSTESESESRNTQIQGSEIPPPTKGGISPDTSSEARNATSRTRVVQWPKLGEEPA